MEDNKEFYGNLWIKGKPEDIDEWMSGDGESFARQFGLYMADESSAEDPAVDISEEDKNFPWFGDRPNEEGTVIRNYSLGDYYYTENNEPLTLETIDYIYAKIPRKLDFCLISVAVEDWPDNGDDPDPTNVVRTCSYVDKDDDWCFDYED